MFFDTGRPDLRADLTDDEVEELLGEFAQPVVARPRQRGGRYSRFREAT
jgi:hypothetical protein